MNYYLPNQRPNSTADVADGEESLAGHGVVLLIEPAPPRIPLRESLALDLIHDEIIRQRSSRAVGRVEYQKMNSYIW
jgi:hypothetical protein